MAQWAQLLPYRCSRYSSSLRQFAAHQTQPYWWCSPFLKVQTDISQESQPVTQFPWLCPALPWSMIQLWSANPLLQTRAESTGVQAKASRQKRELEEWIYAHREESGSNSALVRAFRNTSVSRWDTVSERVSEGAENERWGWGCRGGMLCELCCCFNQCWASVQRELACASATLTKPHSHSTLRHCVHFQIISHLYSFHFHICIM